MDTELNNIFDNISDDEIRYISDLKLNCPLPGRKAKKIKEKTLEKLEQQLNHKITFIGIKKSTWKKLSVVTTCFVFICAFFIIPYIVNNSSATDGSDMVIHLSYEKIGNIVIYENVHGINTRWDKSASFDKAETVIELTEEDTENLINTLNFQDLEYYEGFVYRYNMVIDCHSGQIMVNTKKKIAYTCVYAFNVYSVRYFYLTDAQIEALSLQ